jgi:hypothetical protein
LQTLSDHGYSGWQARTCHGSGIAEAIASKDPTLT